MIRSTRIVGVALTLGATLLLSGCAAPRAHFGEPMTVAPSQKVTVSRVMAMPSHYEGRTLLVQGTVEEVCQAKGCWMEIGDGSGERLFVKFTCPVNGRLIPMEAIGHKANVEGKLVVEEISEAEARHYAEDQGKTPDQIAQINGPQKRLRLMSAGADVLGMEQPEPPTETEES